MSFVWCVLYGLQLTLIILLLTKIIDLLGDKNHGKR